MAIIICIFMIVIITKSATVDIWLREMVVACVVVAVVAVPSEGI